MIIERAELLSVGSLFMFCGDSKQSDVSLQFNLIMGKNSDSAVVRGVILYSISQIAHIQWGKNIFDPLLILYVCPHLQRNDQSVILMVGLF